MIFKIHITKLAAFLLAFMSATSESDVVTFTTSDSFVRVVGYEGSYNMNMSMEIKTWQQEGVLVFHKFSSRGYLKIILHGGQLRAEIISSEEGSSLTTLEHHDTVLSDGKWHRVQFLISQAEASLSVHTRTVRSRLPALVRTGGSGCD